MKKYLYLLLAALMIALCACENKKIVHDDEDDDDDTPSKPVKTELQYAAVNISDTTENADILLACSDGSYLIADVNYSDSYCIFYLNYPFIQDYEGGLTLYLDFNGVPGMLEYKGHAFVFNDVTTATCNVADQNTYDNSWTFYWDVQVYKDKTPEPWDEKVAAPFLAWWQNVEGTEWKWDDPDCKPIVPYILKVMDYCLHAIEAIYSEHKWNVGLAQVTDITNYLDSTEAMTDLLKHDDRWKEVPEDLTLTKPKLPLPVFGELFRDKNKEGVKNYNERKQTTKEVFDDPDNFKFALEKYVLDVPYEGGEFEIATTGTNTWYVETSWSETPWTVVAKADDHTIKATVAPNKETNVREQKIQICIINYYSTSSTYMYTYTYLTIRQAGFPLRIEPAVLQFENSDPKYIWVMTSEDAVNSWSVTYSPNWLNKEIQDDRVILTRNDNYDKKKITSDSVVITARLKNNTSMRASCFVTSVPSVDNPNQWDNTRWFFTGTRMFVDKQGNVLSSSLHEFSLTIGSVDKGEVVYKDDSGEMPAISTSVDELGQLRWNIGYDFVATRTSAMQADCTMGLDMGSYYDMGSYAGTLQEQSN